uniref:Uncharacterized protein n=1 Tax=Ditylum brightwellii TaxID=49249 RepID=A0A6V2A6S6_9STRA
MPSSLLSLKQTYDFNSPPPSTSQVLVNSKSSFQIKMNDTTWEDESPDNDVQFKWTPTKVILSIFLFVAAGLAEVGGGWLVWAAVRGNSAGKKPWWTAIIGSIVLVIYGFIPCLQPTDSFGRLYAVYGGFFIVLSFLLGWILDGDKPDRGDLVGASIALFGVLVTQFWPR